MKNKISQEEFDPRIKIFRKQAKKTLPHITNFRNLA